MKTLVENIEKNLNTGIVAEINMCIPSGLTHNERDLINLLILHCSKYACEPADEYYVCSDEDFTFESIKDLARSCEGAKESKITLFESAEAIASLINKKIIEADDDENPTIITLNMLSLVKNTLKFYGWSEPKR